MWWISVILGSIVLVFTIDNLPISYNQLSLIGLSLIGMVIAIIDDFVICKEGVNFTDAKKLFNEYARYFFPE